MLGGLRVHDATAVFPPPRRDFFDVLRPSRIHETLAEQSEQEAEISPTQVVPERIPCHRTKRKWLTFGRRATSSTSALNSKWTL